MVYIYSILFIHNKKTNEKNLHNIVDGNNFTDEQIYYSHIYTKLLIDSQ